MSADLDAAVVFAAIAWKVHHEEQDPSPSQRRLRQASDVILADAVTSLLAGVKKYTVVDESQPNGNDPLAGVTRTFTVYDIDGNRIKDFYDWTTAIRYADNLNARAA